ncbi:MAG TPA: ATP-binding cassette domain-containing protein, partial [Chitinophagaceae bacterium]|nr:ATP-binding cassette domain-containing protein [Chitinophagaceae bacterium]
MLRLQDVSYTHPNKDVLFCAINLVVNNHEKIALIGNNGTGKSTLLRIIAEELQPSAGQLIIDSKPYYVPQNFGQFDHLTVAQALRIEEKLSALKEILNGNPNEHNFNTLNEDWTIEERCNEALAYWQLDRVDLTQTLGTLSGGQKAKVFLAGISIHQAEVILLDEPGNHLDLSGRRNLYRFVESSKSTMVIVSHDRKLLNLLETVCELDKHGLHRYGGNHGFYTEQKHIERNALNDDIQSKEKALRKAKEKERETVEREQKLDSRG